MTCVPIPTAEPHLEIRACGRVANPVPHDIFHSAAKQLRIARNRNRLSLESYPASARFRLQPAIFDHVGHQFIQSHTFRPALRSIAFGARHLQQFAD